jgi:hypothetical protein
MHGVEFSQRWLNAMTPNDAPFLLAEETGFKKAKQQAGRSLL